MKTELTEYKKEQESKEEKATKGLKQLEQIISKLRTQLDESRRTEADLKEHFNGKEQISAKLKAKVILLKGKGTNLYKFEDSSRILDDILSYQRTSSDKIGLGYIHKTT